MPLPWNGWATKGARRHYANSAHSAYHSTLHKSPGYYVNNRYNRDFYRGDRYAGGGNAGGKAGGRAGCKGGGNAHSKGSWSAGGRGSARRA